VAGIVINRSGIKREGCVPEPEVPEVLRRLKADLEAVVDEEGRPVVRRIYSRDDIGAVSMAFPDLLVETESAFFPTDGLRDRQPFGAYRTNSGLHHPDGIFLIWGSRIRGVGQANADIVDVAPSILGLLGIAPPAEVEGTAREDLFVFPVWEDPPAHVVGPSGTRLALSDKETREIEAHLRALGYTE
jgi:predicted AlkP superfamily phosphohydrolase/phosphomutase